MASRLRTVSHDFAARTRKIPTSAARGVRYSQSPALSTVSPMARDISKLLELAEERVARSERFLRTQRELIETLRRLGHETADANALLLEYDGLHTRFIAARDRLREEQEQSDVAPPTPSVSA